jgi:hypothetical protein
VDDLDHFVACFPQGDGQSFMPVDRQSCRWLPIAKAENLERVGRSRHRRCDPGRAHRLLHPRWLAMHRGSTQLGFAHRSPLPIGRVVSQDYPINGNVFTTSMPSDHIGVVVLASVNRGPDDVLARFERVHHGRHDVKYVHRILAIICRSFAVF